MKFSFNKKSKRYAYEGGGGVDGSSVTYRIDLETGKRECIEKLPKASLSQRVRELSRKIPRITFSSRRK